MRAGTKPQEDVAADVLFMPDWRNGNPYQGLLAAAIESTGLKVRFMNYPTGELSLYKAAKSCRGTRVLHLHWVSPLMTRIFWSRSPLRARLRIWLLALSVLTIRVTGIRVVWTVHNRLSHESPDPEREVLARRWLARAASRLIFHSSSARDAVEETWGIRLNHKSDVVPHGNYLGIYLENPQRAQELSREFGLRPDNRVFLFFGAIRRYKGLSILIDGLREIEDDSIRLIIAGRPHDPDLKFELEAAARADPRIIPRLGFIPEDDVHSLYSIADLAVIPFERTLTSGSAILALSMGKALLLPEEARVLGLPDGGTCFFNGKEGLTKAIASLNQAKIRAMGQHNREFAKRLNWTDIGESVVHSYHL